MITINSTKKNYGINFPTFIGEITADELNAITADIKLPKHYCIIALCFKTKLFDFVATLNSKQSKDISVVPVMAKISDDDSAAINASVGEALIIDRTSLERGVHLNLPVSVGSSAARRYFLDDRELINSIMTKSSDKATADIVIMEFKILPINDVSAAVSAGHASSDPFMVLNKDAVN